jgi:hypothetical protein
MVVQVGVAFLLALEHANGLVISPEENIELDWCNSSLCLIQLARNITW